MAEEGQALPVEAPGWGLLAGEVFEDDHKIVVRIEVPGLERGDFDLEVRDDLLIVRGEKRFQRESRAGGYRLMECAYGSFHRAIPLSAPVQPDQAKARYRNGVLRIELPKAEGAGSRRIDIEVH
jgi:HSP20 family protein